MTQGRGDPVGDGLMDDQPPGGGAALAGGAHRREDDRRHRQIEIGVRRHDDGVVAAEFEDGAAEPAGDGGGDPPSRPGRAGERDQRNIAIVQQQFADRPAAADDEVEQPLRQAVGGDDFGEDVLDGDGGERRSRRRLPQTGVAADGRQHRIPGPDRHREIEGGDDADDPQGMVLFVQPMLGPLRGHRHPVELARLADGEVADVDHLLHFAQPFLQRFAHLQRYQGPQRLLPRPQRLADPADDLAPLRCRHQPPAAKGLPGGGGALAVVLFRGQFHRGQAAAIDRRHHLQHVVALAPEPPRSGGGPQILLPDSQSVEDVHVVLPDCRPHDRQIVVRCDNRLPASARQQG